MTQVTVNLDRPSITGDGPATGALYFRPLRRRIEGDTIVLPSAFVAVLDANGAAVVELAPTGPDWCWMVQEEATRGIVRYVAVPDAPDPVAYSGLVDVDPSTFEPDPPGVPGWVAAVPAAVDAYFTEHPVTQGPEGPQGPTGPAGADGAEGPQGPAGADGADGATIEDLDTVIEQAIQDHTPGIELGYAQTTMDFSTTNTSPTSVAEASLIPALIVTVEGQGRPVDVEFYTAYAYHSTSGAAVMFYLVVNGVAQGTNGTMASMSSQSNAAGRFAYFKRRLVLTDGVSYTFRVGVRAQPGTTPQAIVDTDSAYPTWLGVTSR